MFGDHNGLNDIPLGWTDDLNGVLGSLNLKYQPAHDDSVGRQYGVFDEPAASSTYFNSTSTSSSIGTTAATTNELGSMIGSGGLRMDNPNASPSSLSASIVQLNDLHEFLAFLLRCKKNRPEQVIGFLKDSLLLAQATFGSMLDRDIMNNNSVGTAAVPLPSATTMTTTEGYFNGYYNDEVDRKMVSLIMLIPGDAEMVYHVIGKGGCEITKLENEAKVTVRVETKKKMPVQSSERRVYIEGTCADTVYAQQRLMARVNEKLFERGQGTMTIKLAIPFDSVPFIVGKDGNALSRLASATNAKVEMETEMMAIVPGTIGRSVLIEGNQEERSFAQYLICRQVAQNRSFVPYTGRDDRRFCPKDVMESSDSSVASSSSDTPYENPRAAALLRGGPPTDVTHRSSSTSSSSSSSMATAWGHSSATSSSGSSVSASPDPSTTPPPGQQKQQQQQQQQQQQLNGGGLGGTAWGSKLNPAVMSAGGGGSEGNPKFSNSSVSQNQPPPPPQKSNPWGRPSTGGSGSNVPNATPSSSTSSSSSSTSSSSSLPSSNGKNNGPTTLEALAKKLGSDDGTGVSGDHPPRYPEFKPEFQVVMLVPHTAVSHLIGKSGSVIVEIQKRSGTKISFAKTSSSLDSGFDTIGGYQANDNVYQKVTIVGTEAAIETAKMIMTRKLDELVNGMA